MTAPKDLVTAFVGDLVLVAVFYSDVFGKTWEINEIVLALIITFGFVLGFFYWRRWRELKEEVAERERTGETLRESEERFRSLVQSGSDITLVVGVDGTARYVSPAVERVLGHKPEDIVGKEGFHIMHPDDRPRVQKFVAEALDKPGVTPSIELRLRHVDGSWRHIESTCNNLLDDPVVGGIVISSRDVTERKQAEQERRESEERFRQLFEHSMDALFVHDEEGRILDCNRQACRSLGYSREELLALTVRDVATDLLSEEEKRAHEGDTLWERVTRSRPGEVVGFDQNNLRRKDGTTFPVEVGVGSIDYDGRRLILASARDVTEREVFERQLRHQALHDDLTDLPNRALFMDRLDHALARTVRQRGKVAVLFMDLDNFKVINDSLGHQVGDRLLAAVAVRLRACLRPEDTVARLGGDEFTVLLEDLTSRSGAIQVAERITEELKAPFALGDYQVHTTASIGIAYGASPDKESPQELLRKADIALYGAKNSGKAHHAVFDPSMDDLYAERLRLESDLRHAMERDEFRICYQPKVSLESGQIVGMEALMRWEHPEQGLVSPAKFVSVAEETGLIVPLGRWVLKEACRQAKEWHERYPSEPPLVMCVNLSGRQLQHSKIVADVAEALRETGLEPSSLDLEITESVLMEDAPSSVDTVRRLKDLGVKLVIDDFGTGYSSLDYLKRLPVDYLKIDRSFVGRLGREPEDEVIVSAVIELAHTLSLKVVAEGVETEEQLAKLREMECEMAQGYYFYKPLLGEAAGELLETHVRP